MISEADDDDRADRVRQDVAEDDPPVADADGLGGLDELPLPDRQEQAPDEAADAHPAQQPEDDDDQADVAVPEEPARDEDHEQERQAQHHVDDPHQDVVGEPAEIARDRADDRPDEDADEHAREADQERRPGPVDHEHEDVALEAARLPERVLERRRPAGIDLDVRLRDLVEHERHEERPDDRDDEQDQQDAEPDQGEPVRLELPPGELPLAERLEVDLVVRARIVDPALELRGLDLALGGKAHGYLST